MGGRRLQKLRNTRLQCGTERFILGAGPLLDRLLAGTCQHSGDWRQGQEIQGQEVQPLSRRAPRCPALATAETCN